jgi:predicted murein hydrolase (TIGR00659 family)
MMDFIVDSTFFGVFLSLLAYEIGSLIKRKWNWAIFNPLLIAIVLVIAVLSVFRIDYDTYYQGAKYLSYFLTPATICLAIPLYEKLQMLKDNRKAIFAGILSGVLATLVGVLLIALLFSLNHTQYATLLPKSITTAIGIGVSEELGGIPTITVAVIILSGIFGNMFGEILCKWFRITDPVARGIAIGSASHAIGTARAMELGAVEGAMSSLSIAVSGLITVVGASIFAQFI